jgi:hypothetical protein
MTADRGTLRLGALAPSFVPICPLSELRVCFGRGKRALLGVLNVQHDNPDDDSTTRLRLAAGS